MFASASRRDNGIGGHGHAAHGGLALKRGVGVDQILEFAAQAGRCLGDLGKLCMQGGGHRVAPVTAEISENLSYTAPFSRGARKG